MKVVSMADESSWDDEFQDLVTEVPHCEGHYVTALRKLGRRLRAQRIEPGTRESALRFSWTEGESPIWWCGFDATHADADRAFRRKASLQGCIYSLGGDAWAVRMERTDPSVYPTVLSVGMIPQELMKFLVGLYLDDNTEGVYDHTFRNSFPDSDWGEPTYPRIGA